MHPTEQLCKSIRDTMNTTISRCQDSARILIIEVVSQHSRDAQNSLKFSNSATQPKYAIRMVKNRSCAFFCVDHVTFLFFLVGSTPSGRLLTNRKKKTAQNCSYCVLAQESYQWKLHMVYKEAMVLANAYGQTILRSK
jgi:hypothetical protein